MAAGGDYCSDVHYLRAHNMVLILPFSPGWHQLNRVVTVVPVPVPVPVHVAFYFQLENLLKSKDF